MTSHNIQGEISKAMGWWSPDGFDAYPEKTAKVLALFTTELTKAVNEARTDEAVKALDVAINHQMDSTYDIILVLAAHAKDLEALSAGDGKTGTSLH